MLHRKKTEKERKTLFEVLETGGVSAMISIMCLLSHYYALLN